MRISVRIGVLSDQVEKLGAKHKYWLAGIKRTVYP